MSIMNKQKKNHHVYDVHTEYYSLAQQMLLAFGGLISQYQSTLHDKTPYHRLEMTGEKICRVSSGEHDY